MKLDLRLEPASADAAPRSLFRGAASTPRNADPARGAAALAGPEGVVVAGSVPVLRTVVRRDACQPLERAMNAHSPSRAVPAPDQWFVAGLPSTGLLVIPAGANLVGDCRAHSIYVAGKVRGQLCALQGPLIIAEGGQVLGSVESHGPMVVAGRVKATGGARAVLARGTLALACTARVSGTVEFAEVAVYDGARVEGPMRQR